MKQRDSGSFSKAQYMFCLCYSFTASLKVCAGSAGIGLIFTGSWKCPRFGWDIDFSQEAGRGHRQDNWPKLATGVFDTIWSNSQYKAGGNWLWKELAAWEIAAIQGTLCSPGPVVWCNHVWAWSVVHAFNLLGLAEWEQCMGWASVFCAGEWLHCVPITLYILSFLLLLCYSVKLFLSQPTSFTFLGFFLQFFSPSHWVSEGETRVSEQHVAAGWVVLTCLNMFLFFAVTT